MRNDRTEPARQRCHPAVAPDRAADAQDVPRLLAESFRHYRRGAQPEARRWCLRALAAAPRDPDALHLLGLIAHAEGGTAEAAELIGEAVRLAPENAEFCNNLGVVLRERGALAQAAACHRRAFALKPGLAEAADNLGAVCRRMGRHDEAVVWARAAIESNPGLPSPRFNLALAFHAQGLLREAVAGYRELTRLHPGHAAAHFNLGVALFDLGRVAEAAESYTRALVLRPDYPEALNGLSVVKRIQGDIDEAVALCRRALCLREDFPEAVSHLAVLSQLSCAWEELADATRRLALFSDRSLAAGQKTAEQPMFGLWCGRPPEAQMAIARSWAGDAAAAMVRHGHATAAPEPRAPRDVLRVGYVSSDFRNHPVAHQVQGVLRCHDRRRFEVYAYGIGPDDGSPYRREIENRCDRFVDLSACTDAAAAERIAADGIDILVDLNGHTAGNRMGIFARRPAPVQANFLGYPGTTGSDFHDYLITDRIVTPPGHQRFYTERFVLLPHCYMPADDSQAISPENFQRAAFGLNPEQFVFCSFNNFWKIDPLIFDVWMSLLRGIPRGVLWLPGGNRAAALNLTREARRRGVDAGRLVFADKLESKADHLSRLALADLGLDTRLYNGHVSTCDALWAGVPVLALLGPAFASRASASMLHNVGLAELVAESPEAYAKTALRLAAADAELADLKSRLARNRRTAPLFDTRRFTANLERAYRAMASNHSSGAPPRTVEIHED